MMLDDAIEKCTKELPASQTGSMKDRLITKNMEVRLTGRLYVFVKFS